VSAFAERYVPATYRPPEATYLAWLDLGAYGLGDDPTAWLRANARVALSPGPDFGVEGRGFARLNFATPRPVLEEMLDRLGAALGGRGPSTR
jgi:cystathionine beta-lyase